MNIIDEIACRTAPFAFKDRNQSDDFIWRSSTAKELANDARWYTNYNYGNVNMYFLIYSYYDHTYLLTTFDNILHMAKGEKQ